MIRARRLLAVVSLLSGCQAASPAVLLRNGKVFTSNPDQPWAESVLIVGDRIERVGSTKELDAAAPSGAVRVDLEGRVVVPGFNDAHDHVDASLPASDIVVDPGPVPDPTFEMLRDTLRVASRRHPPGTRLRIFVGERILSDRRARRGALDSLAPGYPVEVRAWSGHGLVLNGMALAQAGIADTAADPLGGRFERDARGRITGLLEEYAGWDYSTALTPKTDSAYLAAVQARAAAAVTVGITTIQNMSTGVDPASLDRILPTLDTPVRIRFIRFPLTTTRGRDPGPWQSLGTVPGPRAVVSGVKYILDGTPVERLAVFRRPYADQPGWYGRLDLPPDTLRVVLEEAVKANQQPMIHAVGDSAVGLVLATLTAVAPDSVWHRLRPRIEHGDGLSPDQYQAVKRLGVVMVQNPSHFALPMAVARYGPERMAILQPAKSLLANGIPLAFGSDGPQNPFLNIMLATLHPDHPAEALTVEQAVSAYTAGSAFAEGKEALVGSLRPGMMADLAVLSQDIFSIPRDQLPATTSVLTLVGGQAMHDPNGWLRQRSDKGPARR